MPLLLASIWNRSVWVILTPSGNNCRTAEQFSILPPAANDAGKHWSAAPYPAKQPLARAPLAAAGKSACECPWLLCVSLIPAAVLLTRCPLPFGNEATAARLSCRCEAGLRPACGAPSAVSTELRRFDCGAACDRVNCCPGLLCRFAVTRLATNNTDKAIAASSHRLKKSCFSLVTGVSAWMTTTMAIPFLSFDHYPGGSRRNIIGIRHSQHIRPGRQQVAVGGHVDSRHAALHYHRQVY